MDYKLLIIGFVYMLGLYFIIKKSTNKYEEVQRGTKKYKQS